MNRDSRPRLQFSPIGPSREVGVYRLSTNPGPFVAQKRGCYQHPLVRCLVPGSALGLLPSIALSSDQATITLTTQSRKTLL